MLSSVISAFGRLTRGRKINGSSSFRPVYKLYPEFKINRNKQKIFLLHLRTDQGVYLVFSRSKLSWNRFLSIINF